MEPQTKDRNFSAAAPHVLARIRDGLGQLYGARIERIVLFGSRARGDASADSDYDVAVILHDYDGSSSEIWRLGDLAWRIQDETGAVVSLKAIALAEVDLREPLMNAIRRDGVAI
jgi:uncharacterized protein